MFQIDPSTASIIPLTHVDSTRDQGTPNAPLIPMNTRTEQRPNRLGIAGRVLDLFIIGLVLLFLIEAFGH